MIIMTPLVDRSLLCIFYIWNSFNHFFDFNFYIEYLLNHKLNQIILKSYLSLVPAWQTLTILVPAIWTWPSLIIIHPKRIWLMPRSIISWPKNWSLIEGYVKDILLYFILHILCNNQLMVGYSIAYPSRLFHSPKLLTLNSFFNITTSLL